MPITKQILVLANSIKKGGRCVAGREVLGENNGELQFGDWIRPIDPNGDEGTIKRATTLIDNQFLRPLEIVEIDFDKPANDPHHPEDWLIDPSSPWRRLDALGMDVLESLPDDAGDLWGAETAQNRRVLPRGNISTLKLIKQAEVIHVVAYRENTLNWGIKHRRLLHVTLDGIRHAFSIDDPLFSSRHNLDPMAVGDRNINITLDPGRTTIVASLTPPFNGHHYKIAATIFER